METELSRGHCSKAPAVYRAEGMITRLLLHTFWVCERVRRGVTGFPGAGTHSHPWELQGAGQRAVREVEALGKGEEDAGQSLVLGAPVWMAATT